MLIVLQEVVQSHQQEGILGLGLGELETACDVGRTAWNTK